LVSYYDYNNQKFTFRHDVIISRNRLNQRLICCALGKRDRCFERRDVIVVKPISCIYGLGIPSEYLKAAVFTDGQRKSISAKFYGI